MKLSKLALAGAIAGLLSAGTAYAQSGLGQGAPVQETAFEYNSYYAQDDAKSPSDQGATPDASAAAACDSCNSTPARKCNECGLGSGRLLDPCCTDLGDQWKLVDQMPYAKCKGLNIGGFIAQGYNWNPANPADKFNGPVTWTDRSNEYNLNLLWGWIEKPTDTKGSGWDFGYRVDFAYGASTRFFTESGLETRGYFTSPKWSTQRFYMPGLPQAYYEVAVDNLKVKIGHFISPIGYETVNTNANFFTSVPMTYQYGEAFTHTGVIGTYQYNPNVSFGGGVVRGWDNLDNSNPNLGAITYYTEKFSDGAQLALVQIASNELNQAGAITNLTTNRGQHTPRFINTVAYSRPLKQISDKLNYVLQSDFAVQDNALLNGHTARWYGLNQYLFYKVSDRLSYGIRYEWFRDEEGFRVGGFLGNTTMAPGAPTRGLSINRSGYQGNFYEITMGANYKFNNNNMIRPYVRIDWFSGTALNGPGTLPYNNGFGDSQAVLGWDMITLF